MIDVNISKELKRTLKKPANFIRLRLDDSSMKWSNKVLTEKVFTSDFSKENKEKKRKMQSGVATPNQIM